MAGDWILIRKELRDDPRVVEIACALGLDQHGVVGRLVAVWSWADSHTENGEILSAKRPQNVQNENDASATLYAHIDYITGTNGFAEALQNCDWLHKTERGILFPDYEVYNGKSGKRRQLDAKRKRAERSETASTKRPKNVRKTSAKRPHESGLQNRTEQKSTEQKRRFSNSNRSGVEKPLSVEASDAGSPPAATAANPAAGLAFPIVGHKGPEVSLPPKLFAELVAAYPGLDVLAELRKARAWLIANPSRKPTAMGLSRFLARWVNRASDYRASARGAAPATRAAGYDRSAAQKNILEGLEL